MKRTWLRSSVLVVPNRTGVCESRLSRHLRPGQLVSVKLSQAGHVFDRLVLSGPTQPVGMSLELFEIWEQFSLVRPLRLRAHTIKTDV